MTTTSLDNKIKVLLADDHEIVRTGIKRLLKIDKDIEIVDEAKNGHDAVELVKYHRPDIALLDILMPKMTGIEAVEKIKQEAPEVLVVMLTAFEDKDHIDKALSAGANGYLSKDIGAKELVKSLRIVLTGERVLSKQILNIWNKKYVPEGEDKNDSIVITKREQEILDLVAKGLTSPQISEQLFISVRTVESHRYNLMQKLGVNNSAALIRFALTKNY